MFDPWIRKIPRRRAGQPTPVFLPGKFQGQRSLAGYSPCTKTWVGQRVGYDWVTEHTCSIPSYTRTTSPSYMRTTSPLSVLLSIDIKVVSMSWWKSTFCMNYLRLCGKVRVIDPVSNPRSTSPCQVALEEVSLLQLSILTLKWGKSNLLHSAFYIELLSSKLNPVRHQCMLAIVSKVTPSSKTWHSQEMTMIPSQARMDVR